ncbi:MAG: cytochrome ubiquinol oxidase subunit I, partial [Thermodesulfobacteriota bacterium]
PDQENERNAVAIGPLPGFLSLLAHHDPGAEVKGLKDFPKEERPPVLLSFLSFRTMVGLGLWFALLTAWGWLRRNRLEGSSLYLKLMVLSLPLPYAACELGWMLAEVGRQPWIVYGVMKTAEAFSPIAAVQGGVSLAAFFLVYSLLSATAYYLIFRAAGRVPQPA